MFFATYVLTQKGPLAKVWLAAHWDKKLTSKDVKVIDLKQTIVHVVQPSVPIALRTSGELMLGIVRIYALKVANLLKDATEATSVLLKPRAINFVKIPSQQQGQKTGKDDATTTNAIAITMDVTVGRIGADELCDADFAEVADLLNADSAAAVNAAANNKNKNQKNNKKAGDDAAAGGDQNGAASWWFATDVAQAVEEIQYTSRHDAEMAKFRAELDKSAAGSSKSGSSGTTGSSASVEHGRAAGSTGNNKHAAELGFVPPSAEDEQSFLMGAGAGLDGAAVMDLDAVLDNAAGFNNMPGLNDENLDFAAAAGGQQQQQQQEKQNQRKLRMVIVVDAETSFKPEALKKMAENRSDIVNAERRHGPLEESEVQDRAVLRDEAIVSDCSSLACYFNNDILRAAFHAAVQAVATERISEIERLRGGALNNQQNNKNKKNNNNNGQDGLVIEQENYNNNNNQQQQFPTFDDEDFNNMMNMGNNNELPDLSASVATAGQRRGRHHDDDADRQRDDAFSASTLATLKHLREQLLAVGAKATTFRAMTQGQNKQTACRTFVDLLHLASHQFVGVSQKEPFGIINVSRGAKFATTAK